MATDTQTKSALQCMKILVSYKICTASSVIEKWQLSKPVNWTGNSSLYMSLLRNKVFAARRYRHSFSDCIRHSFSGVFTTLFLGYSPLIFEGIRHLKEISKVYKTWTRLWRLSQYIFDWHICIFCSFISDVSYHVSLNFCCTCWIG